MCLKYKKTTALTLALALGIGCFSGCKTKGNLKDDTRYTYTMTMYTSRSINDDSVQKKAIEDKYNINLDVWDVEWQKYNQIMDLKIASGEVPDIIYAKSATDAQRYIEQGVAATLDEDYLREKMPNVFARLDEDAPDIMKYYYIDGKLSALPSFSVETGISGIPMVWRGDWLKNVGIDKVPETIDEYEEAFYKIANNDPDGNGKKDTYGLSRSGMYAVFASYGYIPYICRQSEVTSMHWIEKDGTLVYSSVQPEMKQALAKLRKWYSDGVLDPEFITGENKGGYWAISHQFINGVIGFTCHGMSYHWEPMFYEDTNVVVSSQNRYALSKLNPDAADSLEISGVIPKNIAKEDYGAKEYVRGERWMFSKQLVDDKQKFENLLAIYNDIYASKSNYDFATMGEQNVVWKYSEANASTGGTFLKKTYIGDWKDEVYRINNSFDFCLFKPTFIKDENFITPRDIWGTSKGFHLNTHPVNRLYVSLPSENEYRTELLQLEEDAYYSIITGEKPIDYFDEFVSKWYSLGGAVLEKEARDWYESINN